MTYVSSRSLARRAGRIALALLGLTVWSLVPAPELPQVPDTLVSGPFVPGTRVRDVVGFASSEAHAASTVPNTGLEGGTSRSFGPDGQGAKDKRLMTGGSAVDAYGNPLMLEEEQSVQRTRPSPGAYGTRPAPAPSRPLPDLPEGPSSWKF